MNSKKVSFSTILALIFISHVVMADENTSEYRYKASLLDDLGYVSKMSGIFKQGTPVHISSSRVTDAGKQVKDSMTLNYTSDGKFVFSVENKECGRTLYKSNNLPSETILLKSEHGCRVDLSIALYSEKLLSGNLVEHEYVNSVEVTKDTFETGEGIYLLDNGTCEKRTSSLISIEKVTTSDGYSIETPNISRESRTVVCPS